MTDYRIHGISVDTERENPTTRRLDRIEPEAVLRLRVGNRSRLELIALTYEDLLALNSQIAAALVQTRSKSA